MSSQEGDPKRRILSSSDIFALQELKQEKVSVDVIASSFGGGDAGIAYLAQLLRDYRTKDRRTPTEISNDLRRQKIKEMNTGTLIPELPTVTVIQANNNGHRHIDAPVTKPQSATREDKSDNGNGYVPTVSNNSFFRDQQITIKEGFGMPVARESMDKTLLKRETDLYGLPLNERAFCKGLVLGLFSIQPPRQDGKILLIARSEKKSLLDKTLGTHAIQKVVNNDGTLNMYFDAPDFDFLRDKSFDDVVQNPDYFACFATGFLASHMSEAQRRISSKDTEMIEQLNNAFVEHFGIKLGDPKSDRGNKFIEIKDYEGVIATLRKSEKVRQLPFFNDIPGMIKRPRA